MLHPQRRFAEGADAAGGAGDDDVARLQHGEGGAVFDQRGHCEDQIVDAGFLLADLASYGTNLETAYRLPFGLDRANSSFESARAESGLSTLSVKLHFALPRLPAPPIVFPGAPPSPVHLPATTPDPRSLFVGFVYSFLELPAQPMAARPADPRVGYFTDSYTDLSDDLRANPRVHAITRWRLEKSARG